MMYQVTIVSDSVENAKQIGGQLSGLFETRFFPRCSIPTAEPGKYAIIDINLADQSRFPELRSWLGRRPKGGAAIFCVEKGDRRQAAQAHALGATDLLARPFDGKTLVKKLLGDIESLAAAGDRSSLSVAAPEGIVSAVNALQNIFASASMGTPLDPAMVDKAGDVVVHRIEADGLMHWIDVVRKHHSQTYQHCMLVTGVAVTFGQYLGFSRADRKKLAFAGLLHDIGKARIPIAILEKPGPLDEAETLVMKQHPQLGYDSLVTAEDLDPDMLDMVLHHHEYLDGSGYPHGLGGREISDLVRIMTIADIFGALVERRSYRAPMPGEAAYQILRNMKGQLDPDLVREFAPISRMRADPLLQADAV
jgi:putative nucleotidyltransferase with HDIG domain